MATIAGPAVVTVEAAGRGVRHVGGSVLSLDKSIHETVAYPATSTEVGGTEGTNELASRTPEEAVHDRAVRKLSSGTSPTLPVWVTIQ